MKNSVNYMMKYLEALAIAAFSVLLPIKTVLSTVLVLILIDLATGVMASIKSGKKITSAGLRRTISKIVVYEMAIISGFLAEKYLIGDLLPIMKILGGIVGCVELKSILENTNTISGNDLFKMLIDKLGSESTKDQDE